MNSVFNKKRLKRRSNTEEVVPKRKYKPGRNAFKRKYVNDSSDEEERLKKIVFGNNSILGVDNNASQEQLQDVEMQDSGVEEEHFSESSPAVSDTLDSPVPAWHDSDSEVSIQQATQSRGHILQNSSSLSGKYTVYLKNKLESIVGTPRWAELNRKNERSSDEDSEDEDKSVLQHCGNYLGNSSHLSKDIIQFKKLPNLNQDCYTEGSVRAIQFHPNSTVALVAGLSGGATIYQVDGKENLKIQSIEFENFPIHCAHFTDDGNQFIVGSQNYAYFYYHDMIVGKTVRIHSPKGCGVTKIDSFEVSPDGKFFAACGRFGNIHLFLARSKEWIGTLKMNDEVRAISFDTEGSHLYSHGVGGEVYVWDMNSRTCIHKFVDDGCIVGTSIAVSSGNQFLATGSQEGVVNIYEVPGLHMTRMPQPVKIFTNLTTPITSLKFNKSSEILAMASSYKNDAVRLAHFPSMTVFSNFPGFNAHILKPQAIDFSTNSGYMAIGSNKMALLYRLNYYGNY